MSVIKTIKLNFAKANEDICITNITSNIQKIIADSGIKEGIANIFSITSTASITTMEFNPNLENDVKNAFEKIAPSNIVYAYDKNMHTNTGKSKIRAAIAGPGIAVSFKERELILGDEQQIVLIDFGIPAGNTNIVVTVTGEWA
jgi:secondary thiamine-phosphate synthase enzyme